METENSSKSNRQPDMEMEITEIAVDMAEDRYGKDIDDLSEDQLAAIFQDAEVSWGESKMMEVENIQDAKREERALADRN